MPAQVTPCAQNVRVPFSDQHVSPLVICVCRPHEQCLAVSWVWQFEAPPQVARQTDIDMNGHMNNVTYIGLAMEAVPGDVLDGMQMWQVCAWCLSSTLFMKTVQSHWGKQTT
jgi:hypothetical protein